MLFTISLLLHSFSLLMLQFLQKVSFTWDPSELFLLMPRQQDVHTLLQYLRFNPSTAIPQNIRKRKFSKVVSRKCCGFLMLYSKNVCVLQCPLQSHRQYSAESINLLNFIAPLDFNLPCFLHRCIMHALFDFTW